MISRSRTDLDHLGSKTRSQGQIIEKACLHLRDHIFDPILMRLALNICLNDVKITVESGSHGIKTKENVQKEHQKVISMVGAKIPLGSLVIKARPLIFKQKTYLDTRFHFE